MAVLVCRSKLLSALQLRAWKAHTYADMNPLSEEMTPREVRVIRKYFVLRTLLRGAGGFIVSTWRPPREHLPKRSSSFPTYI
jgi:hypothetical protein